MRHASLNKALSSCITIYINDFAFALLIRQKRHKMAKVIVGMTLSLDGYVNDRNGSIEHLFSDLAIGEVQDVSIQDSPVMIEAITHTGAVIMGKHAFLMAEDADAYADHYEFQVPIFVLTSKVPEKKPKENEQLRFCFVTEGIDAALLMAKEAAGERDVVIIGGADTAQQALKTGLVDELHIDIMPVLLGAGLRLFGNVDLPFMKLEKIEAVDMKVRTHLKFRIVKEQ